MTPTEITTMFSAASRVEGVALGFGQDRVNVAVQVNNEPAPRPQIDTMTAMRAAAAFIWDKHSDPEVQEFARRVCNALMPGAQEAAQ